MTYIKEITVMTNDQLQTLVGSTAFPFNLRSQAFYLLIERGEEPRLPKKVDKTVHVE